MVSGGVVRFDCATLIYSNEVLVGSGVGEDVFDWDNREILWIVDKFSTGPKANGLCPKTPYMPFPNKTAVS